MSEHLRYLAAHARVAAVLHAERRACPSWPPTAPTTRCTADELADAHEAFTRDFGLSLVGGCCGTTPEHIAAVVGAGRAAAR